MKRYSAVKLVEDKNKNRKGCDASWTKYIFDTS